MGERGGPIEVRRANAKLGGRKPGSPTRMTRRKAEELCDSGRAPLDVMVDNMHFWFDQSRLLGTQLQALTQAVDKNGHQIAMDEDDRREFMQLAKVFLAARENAQKCAVDAAPYVHPRLQSIALSGKLRLDAAAKQITDKMTTQEAMEQYQATMREVEAVA